MISTQSRPTNSVRKVNGLIIHSTFTEFRWFKDLSSAYFQLTGNIGMYTHRLTINLALLA